MAASSSTAGMMTAMAVASWLSSAFSGESNPRVYSAEPRRRAC